MKNKFFAGRIDGLGEVVVELDLLLLPTLEYPYRLYRITKVHRIYFTNTSMYLARNIEGIHILGRVFDDSVFDSLELARAHMLQVLEQDKKDLETAMRRIELLCKQVSDIGKGEQRKPMKRRKRKNYSTCPECGAKLKTRQGKFGAFLGCSAFPKCRFIKNLPGSMVGFKYGHTGANTMTWRRPKAKVYRGRP